jgi:CRISPR/Cas system-associated protein Cas7 (RAMP superfamily)
MILDALTALYLCAALAMSAALTKTYPEFAGWGNVSRSMAWPVTIYEIYAGLMD